MPNPRDILNRLKWTPGYSLEKAEIWYVHRGAPHDTMIISGGDITDIGKSFMETPGGMIPFHRVFKIVYEDNVIFER